METQNYKMGFDYLPKEYLNIEGIDSLKYIYTCSIPDEQDFDLQNINIEINSLHEDEEERKKRYNKNHYDGRMMSYYEQYIQKHISREEFTKYFNLLKKFKKNRNINGLKYLCEEIIKEHKGEEVRNKYLALEKKANIYFNKNDY
jgi:hypothetical protein